MGSVLGGKYRLTRALGRGGMGSVYKAENIAIGKVVAVKVLHKTLTEDAIAMQRFQREARTMVSIAHPNIVEVLDMGQDASGAPFLVMEYVRGANLKTLLRTGGPLSVERAARVAAQIADALARAHRHGVVHRDLKPENILLTTRHGERHVVKVVDFGISTFAESAAEHEREVDLTPTGLTMATPFYASPEQIRGAKGRDPRVDIYAVGVILYEMLAGHRPFEADNLPDLCLRILAGEIAPLSVFRKDVPAAFEQIVRRALAKRLQDRFQSAEELALALVPFGGRRPRPSEEPEPTDTFTLSLREVVSRMAPIVAAPRVPEASSAGAIHTGPAGAFVLHDALARGLLAHFEQRFGQQEVEQRLAVLPATVRAGLVLGSVHGDALASALSELDRTFGRGDRAEIAAAARRFAHWVLRDGGELPKSTTPELFFSLSAGLWARYFRAGEARVSSVGRGYGRLEICGHARTPLPICIALLALLDEGLRRTGAASVSVRVAKSTAFGDALDAFEASWA